MNTCIACSASIPDGQIYCSVDLPNDLLAAEVKRKDAVAEAERIVTEIRQKLYGGRGR